MKKFLLSLIIGFVGLISFGLVKGDYSISGSDCTISNPCTFDNFKSITYDPTGCNSQVSFYYNCKGKTVDRYYQAYRYNDGKNIIKINDVWNNCGNNSVNFSSGFYINTSYCLSPSQVSINYYSNSGTCPEINTGEILSGYVEQSQLLSCQNSLTACQNANSGYNNTLNSCSNNLNTCEINLSNCLQGNPINSGDIMWSSLFINNIQHPGAGLINITIPEEIERDYSNIDDEFDLEITGYGYDQEKMQSIVNTQYYKPTNEEMSNLVGKIADFLPLIGVALLITRAWRILKKIF